MENITLSSFSLSYPWYLFSRAIWQMKRFYNFLSNYWRKRYMKYLLKTRLMMWFTQYAVKEVWYNSIIRRGDWPFLNAYLTMPSGIFLVHIWTLKVIHKPHYKQCIFYISKRIRSLARRPKMAENIWIQ